MILPFGAPHLTGTSSILKKGDIVTSYMRLAIDLLPGPVAVVHHDSAQEPEGDLLRKGEAMATRA